MAKVIINIPFEGFYESRYSGELDHIEERESEYFEERQEEDGVPKELRLTAEEFASILFDVSDYQAMYGTIARDYVSAFDHMASEDIGLKLGLTFESMTSPRFYNFETDRLFCHIDSDIVAKLFELSKEDKHATFSETIKDRFTSCSGFISHYSNDLESWLEKPLDQWDHNELGTLLIAVLKLKEDDSSGEEFSWRVYYAMAESEDFYNAHSNGVDWKKFDEKVKDLRDDKLEELKGENPLIELSYRCAETLDLFRQNGATA